MKSVLIINFVTLIRPTAFGFIQYIFYIRLQYLTKENEDFIENFIKTLSLSWFAKSVGKWDYIVGVFAKDINELNKTKYEVYSKISHYIADFNINSTVQVYQYRRNYLTNKKGGANVSLWLGDFKQYKLDKKDIQILKKLNSDARIPIIKIANDLDITAKTVMSRIKRLKKDNIIYDYRIGLNLDKLGFKFFKCIIFTKNLAVEQIQKLKSYCSMHQNIVHLVECVGDWDFEIEYEIDSEEKFSECIKELRYDFKDIIKDIIILRIEKESSYLSLPSI